MEHNSKRPLLIPACLLGWTYGSASGLWRPLIEVGQFVASSPASICSHVIGLNIRTIIIWEPALAVKWGIFKPVSLSVSSVRLDGRLAVWWTTLSHLCCLSHLIWELVMPLVLNNLQYVNQEMLTSLEVALISRLRIVLKKIARNKPISADKQMPMQPRRSLKWKFYGCGYLFTFGTDFS